MADSSEKLNYFFYKKCCREKSIFLPALNKIFKKKTKKKWPYRSIDLKRLDQCKLLENSIGYEKNRW